MIELDKKRYYELRDVVKAVGVPFYTISYMLKSGQIKEPKRMMNRRIFTEPEVDAIRDYLKKKNNKKLIKR